MNMEQSQSDEAPCEAIFNPICGKDHGHRQADGNQDAEGPYHHGENQCCEIALGIGGRQGKETDTFLFYLQA